MTSELEQLKVAYETLRMSPEEISVDRELEVGAVKAGLMQCSSVYRRDCGAEATESDILNFTDQDLADVNKVLKDLAMYAEDQHLQFKAATYIRDDKKGRKEVVKAIGNNTFNILQFNESMKAVRDGASRIKNQITNSAAVISV